MDERYDVFVSYSHSDKVFVDDWLVPRLQKAGLRVCVDSKDFEVGVPSLVNMERAVNRSSHTMLVLTPSWIKSEWTDFEALLVGTTDPAGRRRRVLPLMLESCAPPPRIEMLTYAEFREPAKRPPELQKLLGQIAVAVESRERADEAPLRRGGSLVEPFQLAVTYLLATQYPWGEWSDRRTALESSVAERRAPRGPEGPKPNLARTLFALEALDGLPATLSEQPHAQALEWIVAGVTRGWYREWCARQTRDSEDVLPTLFLRKDVRHTAQAATAHLRWRPLAVAISSLLSSVCSSPLNTGLWPESPGDTEPRVLATIYAVEALGTAISPMRSQAIEAVLGASLANQVWSSFRLGVAALHRELDSGGGLLGESASGATPYLTGIGLFRLAPLAEKFQDIHSLCVKMVSAVEGEMNEEGWQDWVLPVPVQARTRKRTTLRVAAGLARCKTAGVSVEAETWDNTSRLVSAILSTSEALELDSPDYACGVVALLQADPTLPDSLDPSIVIGNSAVLRASLAARWKGTFFDHLSRLAEGRELRLPGYEKLARSLEHELSLLEGITAD